MKKDCQVPPPPQKRKAVARHAPSKVQKLEEKIDGLVHLLKSGAPPPDVASLYTSSRGPVLSSSVEISPKTFATSNALESIADSDFDRSLSGHSLTLSSSSTATSVPLSLLAEIHSFPEIKAEDAELYLLSFRTNFINHLPFLVIPPSVTASGLQQERPILWLCIMTVASNRTSQQVELSGKVRDLFGKATCIEGIKSLDLLLGILVFSTWQGLQNRINCKSFF